MGQIERLFPLYCWVGGFAIWGNIAISCNKLPRRWEIADAQGVIPQYRSFIHKIHFA